MNLDDLHTAWADPIAKWVESMQAAEFSPETIRVRGFQVRRIPLEYPDLMPEDVTLDFLTEWLNSHGWSANTKHGVRSALRGFFDWMQYTGRLADNPAARLRKVKREVGRHRPAGELTVRRIQNHEDERVRLMAKLASIESMRVSEIAQVHTDDVLEDLVGYSLIVHGKGRKRRVIPLADEIAREILARPHGWVFPSERGEHLTGRAVCIMLSRALPDGVTGHMLRHRGAGVFYEGSGYDLRATQEFLGHSSPATTQIYTPARVEQMRRGMQAAARQIDSAA